MTGSSVMSADYISAGFLISMKLSGQGLFYLPGIEDESSE